MTVEFSFSITIMYLAYFGFLVKCTYETASWYAYYPNEFGILEIAYLLSILVSTCKVKNLMLNMRKAALHSKNDKAALRIV